MILNWQNVFMLCLLCLDRVGGYLDADSLPLKLDCYIGVGIRAGGCSSSDIRNHELRLNNLEHAGYKNHLHVSIISEKRCFLEKFTVEIF